MEAELPSRPGHRVISFTLHQFVLVISLVREVRSLANAFLREFRM